MSENVFIVSRNEVFILINDQELIQKIIVELAKLGIKCQGKVVFCG